MLTILLQKHPSARLTKKNKNTNQKLGKTWPEKNLFLIQFASKLEILWREPLAGAQFSTAGC